VATVPINGGYSADKQLIFREFTGKSFVQKDCLTSKNGTNSLSRKVGKDHRTLRKTPEERRSHLRRGGSLKSPTNEISSRTYARISLLLGTARVTAAISHFVYLAAPQGQCHNLHSETHDAVRPFSQTFDHHHRVYGFLTTVKMAGLFVPKAEAKI
jgi:hypothetical protein